MLRGFYFLLRILCSNYQSWKHDERLPKFSGMRALVFLVWVFSGSHRGLRSTQRKETSEKVKSMGSSVQGIWGRKAREKMLVKDFRTCHLTYAPVAESLSWVKRDLKSSRYRKSTLIFLFPSGDEIPIWKISCLHLKENNTLIYHRGSEKVRWREFYTNRPC